MSQPSTVQQDRYPELVAIWERSVRATHDFISEADIEFLRPLILSDYLPAATLACIMDSQGSIKGFVGVAEGKVEMLFVDHDCRGLGVGKILLQHAIRELQATKLDVNEQNQQAVGFYLHQGFQVIGRSPVDGMGKPFPLLHMRLGA